MSDLQKSKLSSEEEALVRAFRNMAEQYRTMFLRSAQSLAASYPEVKARHLTLVVARPPAEKPVTH